MRVPDIIGPYAVERELGRGNQGQVWLGKCRITRRVVAIKVSHGRLERCALARWEREYELSRRVDESYVASALDMGQLDDGRLYIVSGYVEGRDLWRWRTTLGPVGSPLRRRRTLLRMQQLADILEGVHEAGVIHGDLKLSAVMVERAKPSIRLLDFGGAQDAGCATAARYFGTARYSSPEQLERRVLTTACDMWSFGVMGVILSRGQWPLKGTRSAVLARLQAQPSLVPDAAQEVDPGGPWGDIVRRCLSLDPARRPSAHEVAETLAGLGARQRWSSPHTTTALGRCRAVLGDMCPGTLLAVTAVGRERLDGLIEALAADAEMLGIGVTFFNARELSPERRRALIADLDKAHKTRRLRLAVVYGTASDLAKHGFKSKRLVHVELPHTPPQNLSSESERVGLPTAVAEAKQALESFCRQTASAEVMTARRALDNQDVSAALSHARRAFAVWPGDSSVIGFLSELLIRTQEFDELRQCLVMAAESQGADLEAIQYAWSRLESVRPKGPPVMK